MAQTTATRSKQMIKAYVNALNHIKIKCEPTVVGGQTIGMDAVNWNNISLFCETDLKGFVTFLHRGGRSNSSLASNLFEAVKLVLSSLAQELKVYIV